MTGSRTAFLRSFLGILFLGLPIADGLAGEPECASCDRIRRDHPDAEIGEIRIIHQDIFGLEDDYREPLVLQVLMGCSTEEIAGQLGLTQGAVLTRLFRARQKLRRSLGLGGAGEVE